MKNSCCHPFLADPIFWWKTSFGKWVLNYVRMEQCLVNKIERNIKSAITTLYKIVSAIRWYVWSICWRILEWVVLVPQMRWHGNWKLKNGYEGLFFVHQQKYHRNIYVWDHKNVWYHKIKIIKHDMKTRQCQCSWPEERLIIPPHGANSSQIHQL